MLLINTPLPVVFTRDNTMRAGVELSRVFSGLLRYSFRMQGRGGCGSLYHTCFMPAPVSALQGKQEESEWSIPNVPEFHTPSPPWGLLAILCPSPLSSSTFPHFNSCLSLWPSAGSWSASASSSRMFQSVLCGTLVT